MDSKLYDHCEECLCYYLKGTKHDCPLWLKALVKFNKDIKEKYETKNNMVDN